MTDTRNNIVPGQQSSSQPPRSSKRSTGMADQRPRPSVPGNMKRRIADADVKAAVGNVGTKAAAGTKAPTGNVGGITASAGTASAAAKKPKNLKVGIIIGVVVVVVAIIVGIVIAMQPKNDFYDHNTIVGQAPYKTEEEIQAELNRIVEEGMLNISIASTIEFEDGTSEGTAYIENVPGNKYVMKVDLKLDDTGETLYESGGIKPDNFIEKIRLNRDLDPGTYSATATFHAYDPDSLEEVGQAAAIVTLNVLH